MSTLAYYAILRFVPDLARYETMNVGVVVALPAAKYFDARIHFDEGRLTKLDPNLEPARLHRFEGNFPQTTKRWRERLHAIWDEASAEPKSSSESNGHSRGGRIERLTENALEGISRDLAGSTIQLSSFRDVEIATDHPQVENGVRLLLDLFERFVVSPKAKRAKKPRRVTPYQTFKKYLSQYDLLTKDDAVGVIPQYRLPVEDAELKFDFGLLNGALHLFETLDVQILDISEGNTRREAGDTLFKFAAARSQADQGVRAYTLIDAEPEDAEHAETIISQMASVSEVYNIADPTQLEALRAVIQKAMGGAPQTAIAVS